MCSNPLDLLIHCNNDQEYDIACSFRKMLPIDMSLNVSRLTYMGGKGRRICTCCRNFKKSRKNSINFLRNRELGTNHKPKPSLSHRDLGAWWARFEAYGTRKDVDDYLIEDFSFDFDPHIIPPYFLIFVSSIQNPELF